MSSISLRSLVKGPAEMIAGGCGWLLIALACLAQSGFGADLDFLAPPQYVGPPQPQHAVTNRAFQGIPGMAVSPRGRLWANWYAGKTPSEDQNNYVVLTTNGDGGATWREVLVVDPDGDGPLRAFDPELWMAPDGKLRMFWAQARGHEATVGGVWCIETADPESEQPAWSKPVRVTNGVMMCKPLVLKTGEWVLPASTWRKTDHRGSRRSRCPKCACSTGPAPPTSARFIRRIVLWARRSPSGSGPCPCSFLNSKHYRSLLSGYQGRPTGFSPVSAAFQSCFSVSAKTLAQRSNRLPR